MPFSLCKDGNCPRTTRMPRQPRIGSVTRVRIHYNITQYITLQYNTIQNPSIQFNRSRSHSSFSLSLSLSVQNRTRRLDGGIVGLGTQSRASLVAHGRISCRRCRARVSTREWRCIELYCIVCLAIPYTHTQPCIHTHSLSNSRIQHGQDGSRHGSRWL